MPFLAPLSDWFSSELKEYYYDYINRDKIKDDGLFSPEIISLRDDFLKGENVKNQKLWNILSFQMWKETWC